MKQFFLIFALCSSAVVFAQSDTQTQLEQARSRVAERAATYIDLRMQTPNLKEASAAQRNEVQAAQEQLLASQNTVFRLSNAKDIYTVELGDSLSSIAVEIYQDGSCWPLLVDANSYLDDPDMIIPGMVLVAPPLPGTGAGQTAEASQ